MKCNLGVEGCRYTHVCTPSQATHSVRAVAEPGVVAFVIATDPEAHRELMDLCAKWHAKKSNSMYIDQERSLESYRAEN